MTFSEVLSLRPGVSLGRADGKLLLLAPPDVEVLGPASPAVEVLLGHLATSSVPRASLDAHGRLLATLQGRGWLTTTVVSNGHPVYTVQPHRCPSHSRPPVPPELVLSRHACVRRDSGGLVVESPTAWCRVRLHHAEALLILGDLAGGAGAEYETPEVVTRLRQDVWWAGLAVLPDEADSTATQWAPHELWFHHRSRMGTHVSLGDGFGAVARAGERSPPPAVREPFPGATVHLPAVDLLTVAAGEPSLTTVMERRRTVRQHDDDAPLTLAQLSEFLFRCARNRGLIRRGGREFASRPYPSGGAAYELELYPVVRRVTGLAPGLYHYDPQQHLLERLRQRDSPVDGLLDAAATAASVPTQPQVLLVVTARFGRVMSKYEAMAYALILKHVGVLYQVMYLVAAAMGLAPCALGAGSSEQFARVADLDPYEESSVGEFMLGSCPAGADRDGDLR